MVSIADTLHLMLGFGMFILTFIGVIISIIKLSQKK
ncbi:putative holin-like toxin [Staphylococcus gallinarum]|nr:putative holin-like toxin [Staphylococcus gallinarum]